VCDRSEPDAVAWVQEQCGYDRHKPFVATPFVDEPAAPAAPATPVEEEQAREMERAFLAQRSQLAQSVDHQQIEYDGAKLKEAVDFIVDGVRKHAPRGSMLRDARGILRITRRTPPKNASVAHRQPVAAEQRLSRAELMARCTQWRGLYIVVSERGDTRGVCPSEVMYALAPALLEGGNLPVYTFASDVPVYLGGGRALSQGFDEDSGVVVMRRDAIYEEPIKLDGLSADRVREHMRSAYALLRQWLGTLRYASTLDHDVLIALALTIVARPALGRRIPGFLVTSRDMDAAKSLAVDAIALGMSGRFPPPMDAPTTAQTSQERVTVERDMFEHATERVYRMDECTPGSTISSPALNKVLSDGSVHHKDTRDFWPVLVLLGIRIEPNRTLAKRLLCCELVPHEEMFKGYAWPSLERDTIQRRPQLIAAALTMLRGRDALLTTHPDEASHGARCGDWPEWKRLIQGAILDAGGSDVAERFEQTRLELEAQSAEHGVLAQLHRYTLARGGPWTAVDLARDLSRDSQNTPTQFPELLDALLSWAGWKPGTPVTHKRLATPLKHLSDRTVAGYRLERVKGSRGGKEAALFEVNSTECNDADTDAGRLR